MSGWSDQPSQLSLDDQLDYIAQVGPPNDFQSNPDFTQGNPIALSLNQQPQWPTSLPQAQVALPSAVSSSNQATASNPSSWPPQHWQGHPQAMMHQTSWSSLQGFDRGSVAVAHVDQSPVGSDPLPSFEQRHLQQAEIAHPQPQHLPPLFLNSQTFDSAWQRPYPPSLGPGHQTRQNNESQPRAPQPSVRLNPSMFNAMSVPDHLTIPSLSGSSYNILNDSAQHAVLTASHSRGRAPREQFPVGGAVRTARRTRIQPRSSGHAIGFRFIPYGIQDLLDECMEEMKLTLFNASLMPTDDAMLAMVDSTCRIVAGRQEDGTLRYWAIDKLENDRRYFKTKLEPVAVSISDSIMTAVKLFVYCAYDLGFDFNTPVDDNRVFARELYVQDLLHNDTFLFGTLRINGIDVSVPFANPAMIALANYLLHDSEYKLHQYIDKNLNFKPLLSLSATLSLCALQERDSGTWKSVEFRASTHQSHYDRFALLFESLTPMQLAALVQLLTNGSTLHE